MTFQVGHEVGFGRLRQLADVTNIFSLVLVFDHLVASKIVGEETTVGTLVTSSLHLFGGGRSLGWLTQSQGGTFGDFQGAKIGTLRDLHYTTIGTF